MNGIVDYIRDNWVAMGVIVLGILNVLQAIAKLTPTDKDDKIVAKIGAVVGYLFGKNPNA